MDARVTPDCKANTELNRMDSALFTEHKMSLPPEKEKR